MNNTEYISRHAEKALAKLSCHFGAVLVKGPRQVGKTTMLTHMTDDVQHITMDSSEMRFRAEDNPDAFLRNFRLPVLIDEIQKCPSLLNSIKAVIDNKKESGLFMMTGSEQMQLNERTSETLAGRLASVVLLGLSLREIYGIDCCTPFASDSDYFTKCRETRKPVNEDELWDIIWKGQMPDVITGKKEHNEFYMHYVDTYLERDIRLKEKNLVDFRRLMVILAARTGQILNYANLADDLGVNVAKVKEWVGMLSDAHIIYLLQPYFTNISKTMIKSPKLYFMDTGLVTFLTRWPTPETLKNGAMNGAIFENFVIAEILKSYYNFGELNPPVYFYRDTKKREIDILIRRDDMLCPFEVKNRSNIRTSDTDNFSVLDDLKDIRRGPGGVIGTASELWYLHGDDMIVPISCL